MTSRKEKFIAGMVKAESREKKILADLEKESNMHKWRLAVVDKNNKKKIFYTNSKEEIDKILFSNEIVKDYCQGRVSPPGQHHL